MRAVSRSALTVRAVAAALSLLAGTPALAGVDPAVGERIYRSGVLAGGRPVEAVVQGDVAVSGAQFSCVACHGRSGMGSVEGRRLAPPVTAAFLDAPRRLASRARPPYTAETLACAIRDGVDAGGNPLDPLMPRYRLGPDDLASLVAYVRTLSAQPSPGAGSDAIHLATIVAPGAPPAAREAMLGVLERYVRAKNAGNADNRQRHASRWPEYYGDWVLHVWQLEGPPATWRAQLEARYREQPVFAVVSGIGAGEWAPVHRFCEAQQLPCILPNVDTPPEAAGDWYSLYFSGGTVLEARAIAAHLAHRPVRERVVLQVFRRGGPGERAAAALAEALRSRGRTIELAIPRGEPPNLAVLRERAIERGAAALVLWLPPADVAALGGEASPASGLRVYLSSTLLGGDLGAPPALRSADAFVAHPYALPAELRPRFARVSSWLSDQRLPRAEGSLRRVVDQTFFALFALNEGLTHVRKNFFRDYLYEVMDHFSGLEGWSSFYPRLSFGPGQRYLSKGCYVVSLRDPGRAEWIVP